MALDDILNPIARQTPRELDKILSTEEEKPSEGNLWKLLDLINRPGYTATGAERALLKGENPLTGAWRGLTGQDKFTKSDILGDLGWNPESTAGKFAKGALGFAGDILDPLDALNWIGLGQVSKTAGKGAKLARKAIQVEAPYISKLLPKTAQESVAKGADKLNEILAGSESFNKINEAIPRKIGEGYEQLRNAPGVSKLTDTLSELFGGRRSGVTPAQGETLKEAKSLKRSLSSGGEVRGRRQAERIRKEQNAFIKTLKDQGLSNEEINRAVTERNKDLLSIPMEEVSQSPLERQLLQESTASETAARIASDKNVRANYVYKILLDPTQTTKKVKVNESLGSKYKKIIRRDGSVVIGDATKGTATINGENMFNYGKAVEYIQNKFKNNPEQLERHLNELNNLGVKQGEDSIKNLIAYEVPVSNPVKGGIKNRIEFAKIENATPRELESIGIKNISDPAVLAQLSEIKAGQLRGLKAYSDKVKELGVEIKGDIPKGMREVEGVESLKGYAFEEPLAKQIEQDTKVYKSPESFEKVGKLIDSVQGPIKTLLTKLSIPFNARNKVAGWISNAQNGLNKASDVIHYDTKAIKALWNNDPKVLKEAEEWGVIGAGQVGGGDIEKSLTAMIKEGKLPENKLQEFNAIINKYLLRPADKASSIVENSNRLALFTYLRDKGMSAAEAAKKVADTHFDYRELTQFEKTFLKRIFPFYTFTKNNVPYQLKLLLTKPKTLTPFVKAKRNLEATIPEEDKIDLSLMDDKMKNRNLIQIPGKNKSVLSSEAFLAASDLGKLTPSKSAQTVIEMLSPLIKMPLEMANNYSFYTGKPLEKFPGEKVPVFEGLLGENAPLVSKRYVKPAADMLRAVREASRNADTLRNDGKIKAVMDMLLGARFMPIDEGKSAGYMIGSARKEINDIKTRLRYAKTKKETDLLNSQLEKAVQKLNNLKIKQSELTKEKVA